MIQTREEAGIAFGVFPRTIGLGPLKPQVRQVRFDDAEALRAQVSDEFTPWGQPVTVTQGMVDLFADLSGDDQWIHCDPDRVARESPTGTTIAHGDLLVSMIPRLTRDLTPFEVIGHGVMLKASMRATFRKSVRVGRAVRARGRLAAVHVQPNGTMLATMLAYEIEMAAVEDDEAAVVCRLNIFYGPTQTETA